MNRKRILFFDDEPFITQMLIRNLQENYGWSQEQLGEITFVSTPKELFDKLNSNNTYDLFVLDIMVPFEQIKEMHLFSKEEIDKMQKGDNSGVVFVERIRSMSKYKDIPILFLSARMKPSDMISNAEYLEKPRFASEISDIMKKMLKISQ